MRSIIVENSQNLTDNEVICRIKNGEYEFLTIIIDRYLPLIVSTVKGYCAPQNVDDAVQEATIALYNAIKTYDLQKSSFYTFASLCIKRSVIAFLRKSGSQKIIPDDMLLSFEESDISDVNSPEKIVIEKEAYDTLTKSIKLELSDMEYNILQHFLIGKSYSDIAQILNVTEKSVDNALSRIRKKLKK